MTSPDQKKKKKKNTQKKKKKKKTGESSLVISVPYPKLIFPISMILILKLRKQLKMDAGFMQVEASQYYGQFIFVFMVCFYAHFIPGEVVFQVLKLT